MESITERCCKVCGNTYPETHFRYVKDGRLFTCRACELAAAKAYYHMRREAILEKKRLWRVENPELAKSRDKAKNSRHPRKPKTRVQMDKGNALKRQKYWDDVEKSRALQREYCAANKEKRRIANHRRRARLYQAKGSYSKEDIARIYISQTEKCYWCGVKLNGKYEIDHIIALSKGGSNSPENICCACMSCNRSKNNRSPWVFNGRLI